MTDDQDTPPAESKLKIGEVLVQEGYLTPEQLERALRAQKTQTAYMPLGAVCVELKFLSRSELEKILSTHQRRIYLGELLTNLGLVTEEQVEQALAQQKSERKRLGQILIERGFLSETTLVNALSMQLGIPKIVPHVKLIDKSLLLGMSAAFLARNEILPAFKQENVLTLIMADPLNEAAIRDLERVFRCEIQPAIAMAGEIQAAITQCFQKHSGGSGETTGDVGGQKDLVIGQANLSREKGDNIVEVVNFLISDAVLEGASDIHIEPQDKNLRVRYRIDGILHHKTDLPMFLAPSLVSRIKVMCGLDIAEKRRHQDGHTEARVLNEEIDFRVSTYVSVHGESVVIRVLHRRSSLVDLDQLGFSPVNRARFQRVLDYPAGIILATGPTGSGKTTSLYAAIKYLNGLNKKIITVEDPVEYTIDGITQGKLDPKLGLSYSDFLKSMMRQDPDVLMVGEIRDRDAAEAVIQAALTGHKVLSTFHTEDSIGALLRLMDMGIETFLISSTVVSVVAQRLVRVLCPHCRQPLKPDRDLLEAFHVHPRGIEQFTFHQPKGCLHCNGTGFKGRTAIHELLALNDSIRDAILARKPSSEIRLIAREKAGLMSLREDGFYKSSLGITSLEEVIRAVFHHESEALLPRSADEIVSLCQGKKRQSSPPLDLPSLPRRTEAEGQAPSIFPIAVASVPLPGEAYRLRLDPTTIDTEEAQITELFQCYCLLLERAGQPVPYGAVEDFVEAIVSTAKRLHMTQGAEFIEFVVRAEGTEVGIVAETRPSQRPPSAGGRSRPETGLRQVNYLP